MFICFMGMATRRCTKKSVYLKYIGKILEKNLSVHNSGDSRSVARGIGGVSGLARKKMAGE